MSLRDFQLVMADLVADAVLCADAAGQPNDVLGRYDLTPRERERVLHAVRHRGMALTCSLYRANRLTPLYGVLPLSCVLLGDRLRGEVDCFWAAESATDLQTVAEAGRFAAFVGRRLREGRLVDPYLADVLAFEVAAATLQALPRRAILAALSAAPRATDPAHVAIHPLVRLVPFAHDPAAVLTALTESRRPESPAPGDFYLVLDATADGGELAVRRVPVELGRTLDAITEGRVPDLVAEDVEALLAARLVAHRSFSPPSVAGPTAS